MIFLYVLGGAAILVGAAVLVGAVRRSRQRRAAVAGMAERLRQSYRASGFTGEPATLAPPGVPGKVGVDESGLHLRIGDTDGGLWHVPWAGVQSVTAATGGRCSVHVSRVGVVVVPGTLGRRIWDLVGRARSLDVERARAARV